MYYNFFVLNRVSAGYKIMCITVLKPKPGLKHFKIPGPYNVSNGATGTRKTLHSNVNLIEKELFIGIIITQFKFIIFFASS